MTKRQIREAVYNKFGGRCAYCGDELKPHWHIDHVKPVVRNWINGKMGIPERDDIGNMFPACPTCNNWKHSMPLEAFRTCISNLLDGLRKRSPQYRMALKYGLINEYEMPIFFYFERIQNDNSKM